ncbi:Cof-type HAD-IIB family hydrolase [Atopobacter sp. AH10]|uniref:Cof-type HAD-IIB family hydrolase n=1 Tax=Atopobacter sp. AH10 TaxID=2315861 RepID=UPI0013142676|nr:Cof-type HAD-IIB family hydrolase [Atopobacter sp. AH10]
MQAIKLMAIDMDGTLLTTDKELSLVNQESLNQAIERGHRVVLCTGRPMSGIKPFLDRLDFTDDDFIIANNGATILEAKSHRHLMDRGIPSLEMKQLVEMALSIGGEGVVVGPNSYYSIKEKANKTIYQDAALIHATVNYRPFEELMEEQEFFYKLLLVDCKEKIDAVESRIPQTLRNHYYIVRSQPYLIEIQAKGVHKGSGLAWLLKHLGLQKEQLAAIGDAANDKEMLEMAALAIAMGNASEEIKALADKVVASNDDNGVAQAIKFVFEDSIERRAKDEKAK